MKVLLMLLVVGSLLLVPTSRVLAEATTTRTVTSQPFTFTTVDPCNGEPVAVSGFGHGVLRTTVDADGGTHFEAFFHTRLAGTGLVTGTEYEFIDRIDTKFKAVDVDGQWSGFTQVENTRVISHGSGSNWLAFGVHHYTVTPSGEFNVTPVTFNIECYG